MISLINFLMLMFFIGNYMLISNRKHLLNMLLSLEFLMLILMFILFFYLAEIMNDIYFLMMFLVMMVCEGVLGVSILVVLIRMMGSDYFQIFNLLKC
uniref:NADH-ubiquinone oxidoreductase chain 4L n=1 Tax=Hydromanicus wulaianus TaxID=1435189 RepID=A0A342CFI5_9NEOP|nr:NADH dehydrogenase subunit 4L [Hydromanicus wulaianus]AHC32061.1 NADH dehydrogenase subunit 4L [Hydromanicus wulaianus]